MLTILHDRIDADGRTLEIASAEGFEVICPSRAACRLAELLIGAGYGADHPVRLVRADPWLHGAPHHVSGLRLDTAAAIDFFGTGPYADIASPALTERP